MKDKDYIIKTKNDWGVIRTDVKPITEYVTKCIICDRDVVVSIFDAPLKVCDDCKRAVFWLKELINKRGDLL